MTNQPISNGHVYLICDICTFIWCAPAARSGEEQPCPLCNRATGRVILDDPDLLPSDQTTGHFLVAGLECALETAMEHADEREMYALIEDDRESARVLRQELAMAQTGPMALRAMVAVVDEIAAGGLSGYEAASKAERLQALLAAARRNGEVAAKHQGAADTA